MISCSSAGTDPAYLRPDSSVSKAAESYGFYAQSDGAILPNLHFNAGSGTTNMAISAAACDPRMALIYNPLGKLNPQGDLRHRLSRAEFHGVERSPIPRRPARSTSPATNWITIRNRAAISRSSIRGYYNQMDHLIVFDNGNYTNFNAQTKGVELALEGYSARRHSQPGQLFVSGHHG